ncbi:uncharacterized protein LOC130209400 isoform X3 [Pseudoliparis swirei]|uniref:uncharacterized protein LOC130209400 isoform X3 n=1 Tax=Pseudoliparis swirei TaxID=2059687 RepID=UPI0024BD759D|nr:uncharacterized protein LOC130209400 isoform X3 [Pseudoliparis swirei]XP_056295000.1 uncharacterized protein LOC130209400 isoform X3 [Pseudoliparis swirei]XP_056295001.1 uncharacterized protein LOC130209400 isoform X3 [Pseudoliparis swirei]
MMILLLLLGAFVSTGFSRGIDQEREYGENHRFWLRQKPEYIEFHPKYNSSVITLWKKGDRAIIFDKKYMMTGSYFMIYRLTQKDSGRYIMRDTDLNELSSSTLDVKVTPMYNRKSPGDRFHVTFNLNPNSCNIYFFPRSGSQPRKLNEIVRQGMLQEGESDCLGFDLLMPCGILNKALQMSCSGRYEIRDQNNNTAFAVSLEVEKITNKNYRKAGEQFDFTLNQEPDSCDIYFFPESQSESRYSMINIVHRGRLAQRSDDVDCTGFDLLKPCGISKVDLQISCAGRYEIKDQNNDTASVVSLEIKQLPYEPSHIGIGFGVFLSSLFCYCVKCCCCGKSSSKEDGSETAAADPDAQYQANDDQPAGAASHQLMQPSAAEQPPPAYEYPSESLPPPYPEVSAPVEQPDAPSGPVYSDPEPKFEMKGVTFPSTPLLSSDSTSCDVYTSEKFNFL